MYTFQLIFFNKSLDSIKRSRIRYLFVYIFKLLSITLLFTENFKAILPIFVFFFRYKKNYKKQSSNQNSKL